MGDLAVTATAHETGLEPAPMHPLTLGFTVLGAPVAWSLHLLLCYFIVALDCTTGWGGAVPAIVIATVVLGAVAAWAGAVAFRHWPPPRGIGRVLSELGEPVGRDRFLMLLGMALSALFTLAILATALAPLFVPTCPFVPGILA